MFRVNYKEFQCNVYNSKKYAHNSFHKEDLYNGIFKKQNNVTQYAVEEY